MKSMFLFDIKSLLNLIKNMSRAKSFKVTRQRLGHWALDAIITWISVIRTPQSDRVAPALSDLLSVGYVEDIVLVFEFDSSRREQISPSKSYTAQNFRKKIIFLIGLL